MTKQKYELINNQRNISSFNRNSLAISLLTFICILLFTVIFLFWDEIYNKRLNIPQKSNEIPLFWQHRLEQLDFYINNFHASDKSSVNETDNDKIIVQPSKFGSYIYSNEIEKHAKTLNKKLVCYYTTPSLSNDVHNTKKTRRRRSIGDSFLNIRDINPFLCTHINIGVVLVSNCSLKLDKDLISAIHGSNELKSKNDKLKILLWVGAADESEGFPEVVANHSNRKRFIQSVKETLEKYGLDGIDLDWEFPNGSNQQRIHFMQLLHDIRREYQREHSTFLLSLAVAAPSIFVDMCYDVRMINENVDYVNIMTYDYHFYTKGTPYTGFNAPLYARSNEKGFFETLNINYSVNYWMSKGLDRSKIIIGLPTYGHSFKLVNPFNTKVGAPAEDIGSVGTMGFVTYSEVCWFRETNYNVRIEYDTETCSPWLYAGLEWISYDDERSIECKTNYAKNNHFGGVMIFSLNTDDFQLTCSDKQYKSSSQKGDERKTFPLLRKVHSILFHNSTV
ncbi:hypothetical protein ACKWTF_006928 [Chironomus riparius]